MPGRSLRKRPKAETAGSARGVALPSGLLLHRRPITRRLRPLQSLRHRGPRLRPRPHHRTRSTRINLVSQIVAKLATDERFKGLPASGKDGRDGKDGQNGTTPKVDQDAIVAAVLAKIDLDEIARECPSPRSPLAKFITW